MDSSFFDSLDAEDEFVYALGKLVLSSAKLEAALKRYMDSKEKVRYSEKAPLGALMKTLTENHYIDQTAKEHFHFLLHQRNYFVHRLYLYLSECPSDQFELSGFINRAKSVSEEMEFFGRLLTEAADKQPNK